MLASLTYCALAAPAQTPPPRDTLQRRDTLRTPRDSTAGARDTSRVADSTAAQDSALTMQLLGRLEFRGERTRNDRCLANQLFVSTFRCQAPLTPELDFQFALLSGGSVADRVRVDVDYDSQREFDASNNISISYAGKPGEWLERVQVGNVSFAPAPSRFITSGIPSGNYGVQAAGRVGRMRFSAILAQQKGNIIKDQVFLVGARTTQTSDIDVEDYQIEPRRFFFTVDPALFPQYPNIDILDAQQMAELVPVLPDTIRPSRVFLYRLLLGGQPPNPDGPRFTILGAADQRSGPAYELLREGVDYYIDPSMLWFALVRPLSLANERLVVAYTLRINGRDTTIARLGGTPDLEFTPDRPQYAHLLWDPRLSPDDATFRKEIRSIYRVGGSDVRRETASVRIVAASGGDLEKPPGVDATYLELFRLAKKTDPAAFDAENRLWPRPNDPNDLIGPTAAAGRLISDVFLVFPSLEPFSRRGLAQSPSVVPNDTLYRTPGEYLYSAQHPQSIYRLRLRYESDGLAGAGTVVLPSTQIRRGSERITMDGRPLIAGLDYDIDYDLGRLRLLTADTLALRPHRVVVRYEENPLFQTVPTSIMGLTSELTLPFGNVAFTAIAQNQRTNFTRPALGFEPQGSLVAGVSSDLGWALPGFSRSLARVFRGADSNIASRLAVRAELAVSQPRQSGSAEAYVESFDFEGGVTIALQEALWQYGSQPALGSRLASRYGAASFDTTRAATLAYQNFGTDAAGNPVTFSIEQIDPLTVLPGGFFSGFEQILWLTLYPLNVGGVYDRATDSYKWHVAQTPTGRRWRSVRTPLGPGGSGVDLSRAEHLQFATLIDTSAVHRGENPVLIFDFGDVSENTVAFSPESLRVSGTDSVYSGKALQGFDVLDSERDPFSRAFSAQANDLGLPGHVVSTLALATNGGTATVTNHRMCALGGGSSGLLALGDARIDCSVANSRLDEEDIDQDAILNLTSAQREQERIRRFIVDLSDPRTYSRIGGCGYAVRDVNDSHPVGSSLCWVHVRVPFAAPDDSVGGGPLLRRVRSLRVTVLSGPSATDDRFTLVPITRLTVLGSTWTKRAPRPLRGVGGEVATLGGYVVAGVIGTQDSTQGLVYEPPPGVTDEPEQHGTVIGVGSTSINERSMRLIAGDVPKYGRAEAYWRFPEGDRNVMTYRELRLWARGRGRGWGMNGDLEFFVKLGRDANNFYLYRTPVNAGQARAAWEPEIRVRFSHFYALRQRLAEAAVAGSPQSFGCTALDSALIAASGLPAVGPAVRAVACDGPYMVYSVNPAVTPPNLAAVQEVAVGILRVDSLRGPDPPLPGDSLELWIDDIRLGDAERRAGYAALVDVSLTAGDAGAIHLAATRRDPNFRQLGEQPTFYTGNDLEIAATWRLDKLLPASAGVIAPLTITHVAAAADPTFLARTDLHGPGINGLRTPQGRRTAATLSVRRSSPLTGGWLAPLVNHLGLTATWNGLRNRNEFSQGKSRALDVGADYFFLASPVVRDTVDDGESGHALSASLGSLPGSSRIPRRERGPLREALGATLAAVVPASARITSNFIHADDSYDAFVTPVDAPVDRGRRTDLARRLLRNTTSFELRPASGLTARWDAITVYDLRDYPTTGPGAPEVPPDRVEVAGVDLGVQRERNMLASVLYAPATQGWFRPGIELSSSFTLLRDPNAPAVNNGGTTALQASQRFGNTQRATVSALLDVGGAAADVTGDTSLARRVGSIIGPIDVRVTRDQLSSYDASPNGPSWQYQLGFGSVDAFREIRDVLAASAGAGTQYVLSNAITLPFGATIAQRMQYSETHHWSRRLQDRQSLIDGVQRIVPDVSLRWSGRPALLGQVFSAMSATARVVHTRQAFVSPADIAGLSDEVRSIRMRSYPLSASVTTAAGAVSLTTAYATTRRVDSLPGSVGESSQSELSADAAKEFPLPATWKVDRGLRTRVSYQWTQTQSYVSNISAQGARSRLTDNGRQAFTLNAGTDLAENLAFSIQGSRVVTFDRNFNRRFTQTVLSAVLNIQFFGGALR